MPNETSRFETKPKSLIYLPGEGLQGEGIPSYILWENMTVESVQVSLGPPLRFKEIFNAESWEIHDNVITIRKVGIDGYIGLSFESSKVPPLEVMVPIKYLIYQPHGDTIKEVKRIRLFKPKLEIQVSAKEISINPDTGFVKGRIGIKNVGRGTLIMSISTTENSPTELKTPPEHREFAEKFASDLNEEMSNLAKEFPEFQPVWDEMMNWEKRNLIELSSEERDEFVVSINRLANILASNKDLLRRFAEAYAKAFARNIELIEAIKKFVSIYESLVSKDLLLINPFDEVDLSNERAEIVLKIIQTDKVFDTYEDVMMPKIQLSSSQATKVPIYKLFKWG